MLPILLKPRLLSAKNTLLHSRAPWRTWSAFSGLLLCIALLMLFVFSMSVGILDKARGPKVILHISPFHFLAGLGLLYSSLLGMAVFVHALQSLFLNADNERILASPLSKVEIFHNRFAEMIFAHWWQMLLLVIPALYGISYSFHAPLRFLVLGFLIFFCFSLISAALAVCASLLVTLCISPKLLRDIGILLFSGILVLFYFLFLDTGFPSGGMTQSLGSRSFSSLSSLHAQDILHFSSLPLPTNWGAQFLDDVLFGAGFPASMPLLYLCASTLLAVILAACCFCMCYDRCLAKTRSLPKSRPRRILPGFFCSALPAKYLPQTFRALGAKEWRSLSRDFTQALQIIPLLAVVCIYLVQLRILGTESMYREEWRTWWQTFLVLGNIFLSACIMLAVCSRFVFPKVSLEGRSWWIIQKSPLSLAHYLRTQFYVSFWPLCAIHLIVTLAGAMAVQAPPRIILLSCLASVFLLVSLVGVAIGLGARFAQFHWEHSAQITSSYGNLAYLISGFASLLLGFFPLCALLGLRTARIEGIVFPTPLWLMLVLLCSAALVGTSFLVAILSIKRGEESLRRRLVHSDML